MDYYKLREKRTMTPEKMVEILGKHGTIISKEKAGIVLELVYKLSNLSVGETIRNAHVRQKLLLKKNQIPKHILEDS
ncbi:hypothetical protein [Pedobacter aquatilis]|uniref:hypothetical protein n=1 Tax=Pedobacter aquatilis TaxID=351343 RepID=UPI00293088E6|nr:hypothetical protein [Pedobacter aquatilis]